MSDTNGHEIKLTPAEVRRLDDAQKQVDFLAEMYREQLGQVRSANENAQTVLRAILEDNGVDDMLDVPWKTLVDGNDVLLKPAEGPRAEGE